MGILYTNLHVFISNYANEKHIKPAILTYTKVHNEAEICEDLS